MRPDDLPKRVREKIEVDPESGCWNWTAYLTEKGYGRMRTDDNQSLVRSHRYTYEAANGPIPDGMELDHLCRNRSCVNPRHLEAVTHAENMARSEPTMRTECPHGHEYTEENTIMQKNGNGYFGRTCLECSRKRNRDAMRRKRSALRLSQAAAACMAVAGIAGCSIGPLGMTFGYTLYEHTEMAPHKSNSGSDPSEYLEWRTRVFRPWGTSNTEWYVDTQTDRGTSGGDGLSANMRAVIGDDALANAVRAAVASQTGGASLLLPALTDSLSDDEAGSQVIEVPPGTSPEDVEAIREMLDAYAPGATPSP